jgi:glyoxylase-like metal-dependent hydrolase (beta-lactamase superfamily II)
MQELAPGLFTWTRPHPEWKPSDGARPDGWQQEVRSYALDAGDVLVLIDPLDPPAELPDKDTAVVLTVWAHERSAGELDAPVLAPAGSLERIGTTAQPYEPGATLPGGIEAKPTPYPDEGLLWLPGHRALVSGDLLLGSPPRICPESWLAHGNHATVGEALRPMLDLPIERFLPTHGDPVLENARAALAGAFGS